MTKDNLSDLARAIGLIDKAAELIELLASDQYDMHASLCDECAARGDGDEAEQASITLDAAYEALNEVKCDLHVLLTN
jgi:hypothetical protein